MALLACLATPLLILWLVTPASAQQPWSLSVDLPVALHFTGDGDAEPTSVSGYDLAVFSPWYVGVGLTRLHTGIKDFALNDQNLDLAYSIVNLLGKFTIGDLVLGLGIGRGTIAFDPETSTSGAITQTFSGGDVQQSFLFAGWKVTGNLDIHASQHAILAADVKVDTEIYGVPFEDQGDIGAIMTTLGLGYYF
jgi:hypothetical protein